MRRLVNAYLERSFKPGYERFASADPAETQGNILRRILERNADTSFGQRYGFGSISDVTMLRERIPVTSYDDYKAPIERIMAGENRVLTHAPVRLLEPTSGTSGEPKLIPYTDDLRAGFRAGIDAWLYDLMHTYDLRDTTSMWLITPRHQTDRSSAVPIGFDSDSSYLSPLQSFLISRTLTFPDELARIDNTDRWLAAASLLLAADRNVGLMSVWSPSLLLILLEEIERRFDRIISEIREGTNVAGIRVRDPRRAAELERLGPEPSRIFPKLRVVSCWLDASAAAYRPALERALPQAELQGKGLISTEAFVSFPSAREEGHRISFASHFFEFLRDGEPFLLEELETGSRYSVIVTTQGGLYRYATGDVIEVLEAGRAPRIRFVGRGRTLDLVGEKITEGDAVRALEGSAFGVLSAERVGARARYVAYVHTSHTHELAERIEAALLENFHYNAARENGQLLACRIVRLESDPTRELLTRLAQRQRLGDVKLPSLDTDGRITEVLDALR